MEQTSINPFFIHYKNDYLYKSELNVIARRDTDSRFAHLEPKSEV